MHFARGLQTENVSSPVICQSSVRTRTTLGVNRKKSASIQPRTDRPKLGGMAGWGVVRCDTSPKFWYEVSVFVSRVLAFRFEFRTSPNCCVSDTSRVF